MHINTKKSNLSPDNYLIVVILLLVLIFTEPLYTQPVVTNLNFSANNERLSIVLYRLSNEADINFTYNSADNIFDKKITYKAVNKQPLVILDELLSTTNYKYKKVGNQIVIYKKKSKPNVKPVKNALVSDNMVNNSKNTSQMVFDTVFITDTTFVILVDTVRITDTVFVEKVKKKKPVITKIKEIPSDYFNPTNSREKGWSASLFVAPILANFSLAHDEGTMSFRNFSFGIEVSKIINNWNVTGGIKLTQFAEKFNHSYSTDEGGFFVIDTIDTYYTIVQNDTAWYFVTDSTWKPIDSHQYDYNVNNRVGYIELMASASFDYFSNRNLRLYVKIGAQAGILVYNNGIAIPNKEEPVGVNFADLNFNTSSYSVLFGTGVKYRINKQLDFNSEIYYLNYTTNMIDNYPVNNKIKGVGAKFGLIYYF